MSHSENPLGPALLFCPGDRPERFSKAIAAADVAVLDLEDGVHAAGKDAARAAVVAHLGQSPAGVVVRINHPSTARGRDDARAVLAAGCHNLLLPKTETPEEIAAITALAPATGGRPVGLIVTIETSRGLARLRDILAMPGVTAVSWGPYDLAANIGARDVRDTAGNLLSVLALARDQILLAAAAAVVAALDTVTTELRDAGLIRRDAAHAAQLGFVGKFAIHPTQTAPIREAFRPRPEDVARSRQLIAAQEGQGAYLFDGEMVDEPILNRARRLVALHERLASTPDAAHPEH